MNGAVRKSLRIQALSGASAIALLTAPSAAAEPVTFDISADDLAGALNEFALQSDREIVYDPLIAVGLNARAVQGRLEPVAALDVLLADSGLAYRVTDVDSIIIERAPASGEGMAESIDGRTLLAQAETGAPGTSTGRTREKIIVTGQKREEYIQDVPIAISAFTQEDLTISQIAGGPDLITQIPNFTFTKTNFSGYSIQIRGIGTQAISATTDPAVAVAFNNTPFIRNRFFEQEFYDLERVEVLRGPQGTLYGRNATAGVVNLLTAKPVLGEDEARISVDLGNFESQRFEAMANVPLVDDQVALRLAGAWTKRDGYATNEITGRPIDGRDLWSTRLSLRMAPSDRLDATLIWEHFEEEDDRLRSGKQLCKKDIVTEIGGLPANTGQNQGFSGHQGVFSQGCERVSLYSEEAFQTPNGLMLPFYTALSAIFLPAALGDPYVSNFQSQDLRVIESTIDPEYRANTDIGQLSIDFELTDDLTLTSETAYGVDTIFSLQDFNRFNTQSGAWETMLFGELSPNVQRGILDENGVFCDPQLGCSDRLIGVDVSTAESTQFSQEFRLASAYAGPFNFSFGGNFLRYDTVDKFYVFINSLSLYSAIGVGTEKNGNPAYDYIPGVTDNSDCLTEGPIPPGYIYQFEAVEYCQYIETNPIGSIQDRGHNYFLSKNPYKLISYSAFGEAYWNLTDNLKLTAGLRYTVDKKDAPRIPSWVLAAQSVGYPVAEVIKQEWREPTGRLALDWKPELSFTDETLIYGSYARGYKAGGANPPTAGIVARGLAQNTAISIEDSATRPRTFDAEYVDAFEIGSKNTLLDGDLTLNLAAFYYDYEGYQISEIVDRSAFNRNFDAEIWGVEIEAEWWARENLRLSFKGGYENTRMADGSRAVDLMDRTAGNEDWQVVKPFPTFTSNCILPVYTITGTGSIRVLGNVSGGSGGGCEDAYLKGVDPVTELPYVPNPPNPGGGKPWYPGYPGFNPLDESQGHNGGEGFFKDLSGNELPNAPPWTATLSGDYILPLGADWTLTFHTDLHYQSESWWRVFQDHEYARLNEYYTMNLAAILASEDGWNVMGYVKNVTDETAITGAFLYSDDVGLTTNLFLTEPRLYGVRVTKDWTGGTFLGSLIDGDRHDPNKPYKFEVMVGGQVQRWDAPNETYSPDFLDVFPSVIDPRPDQDNDLDWGDGREIKVTYRPDGHWRFAVGARFGKTNNKAGKVRIDPDYEQTCQFGVAKYCDLNADKYGGEIQYGWILRYNISDSTVYESEEYELVDFEVGREVGIGAFGSGGSSMLSAGLRYAQLQSTSVVNMYGFPDWRLKYEDFFGNYGAFVHRYEGDMRADREFEGVGPVLSWEASTRLLGGDDTGNLNLDWSVSGGALFGKQKTAVSGDETTGYYNFTGLYLIGDFDPLPGYPVVTPLDYKRSQDVTVPTVGASLGLSYKVDRFRIGAGYRWERYYDALDGGVAEEQSVDRTIDGPYLNVSVGFGG